MKFKKTITSVIFLFSCTLTACMKEKTNLTTIRGEVRNKLTNELLSNIPLEIIECDSRGKCLETIKTIFTDNMGLYNCTFEANGINYKIAIGSNDIIPGTPYPYYHPITKNVENLMNFSVKPLKILQLKIKMLRHDKNWMLIGTQACDGEGYADYELYRGLNPSTNFDTIYNFKIEAGRRYRVYVGLYNKIANNYQDSEFVFKYFTVENIDTAKVEFIVL